MGVPCCAVRVSNSDRLDDYETHQRENDTLTAEMDKVLAENAMIRDELEDLKENVGSSRPFMGHNTNTRSSTQITTATIAGTHLDSFAKRLD